MGFRFRKIIPLTKGLKLNLSKSGLSVSAGRPGATVNFGMDGMKATTGLPGSGLGYQARTRYGVFGRAFLIVLVIVLALWLLG